MEKKTGYKPPSVPIYFRIDPDTAEQLDYLCALTGCKRGSFLAACIHHEFDKSQNSPQLQRVMDMFKDLNEEIQKLTFYQD